MRKLLTISFILLSVALKAQMKVTLENQQSSYPAGERIALTYCLPQYMNGSDLVIAIFHSFGTHQMASSATGRSATFHIPKSITRKSGLIKVRAFYGDQIVHTTELNVVPLDVCETVESYCGPKHIVVDRDDYTMIVSTPLDSLDNPLPKGTSVEFNYQFGNGISKTRKRSKGLYVYDRFFAMNNNGYGTLSANHEGVAGKAFRLQYYSHDPKDFQIFYRRQHAFADGEQVVTLQTSIIQDLFGNVIGNGTMVKFKITDQSGATSEIYGQTMDGVAKGIKYAPLYPDTWTVTASIENFAQSQNRLSLPFKPSIKDFELQFDESKKTLLVGPVIGYLNQWIQNGKVVEIALENDSEKIVLEKEIKDGRVLLSLNELRLTAGEYEAQVKIAGITKKIKLNINA